MDEDQLDVMCAVLQWVAPGLGLQRNQILPMPRKRSAAPSDLLTALSLSSDDVIVAVEPATKRDKLTVSCFCQSSHINAIVVGQAWAPE